LKGFMSVQIFYMPNNVYNGGTIFSFFAMVICFLLTLYSLLKLLEARAKVDKPSASYSDIAEVAFGKTGRVVAEVMLCLLQYCYVIPLNFFVIDSIRSIIDELFAWDPNLFFVGKRDLGLKVEGMGTFLLSAPLLLIRSIQKFAFTFILADIIIFFSVGTILVYALLHL
jgi:proton-coupled amino acid transporter